MKNHKIKTIKKNNKYCKCGCDELVKMGNKFVNGHNKSKHKYNCHCFVCKNKRKEPHKLNCNCMACRMIRGETKGSHHPFYGKKQSEINKKKMSNNHVDFSGHLNPNWLDGRSFEEYPQEFNYVLKEKIRKRDNYTCQKCFITEEEYLIVYGICLSVHHIDYDKKNNDEYNLTTLCNECNARVNFNRDYWQNFFKGKIIWKI